MINVKSKKILEYYHNISPPAKASMWFLIASIVQKCFSMISTPIFTRFLTTEQYGLSANYYSWYELLVPFVTMYIYGVAYNNILIKQEDDIDNAMLSLMTLSITITGIFFAGYLFLADLLNSLLMISTPMMCIMFGELLMVPIFNFWAVRERFQYRYKKLVMLTILNTVLALIFGVIGVLLTEQRYEAKVISKAIITVIVGFIILIQAMRQGSFQHVTKYWKYALKISLPLIPHYFSLQILNQSDRVMISKMVGSAQTGIYSVAYMIAIMIRMVTDAINTTLCPTIYKAIKENNIKRIPKRVNEVLLFVLIATLLEILVAPEVVRIFATEDYMDAIWIIPPVALSIFFMFIYVLFSNVEFYYEKTVFTTVISGGVALVNIVLNYFCILKWGYYAAGFTTLICYILFAIVHYCNYRKVINQHPEIKNIYDIRCIVLMSMMGLILMIVSLMLYPYTLVRWIIIVASFVLVIWKKDTILGIIRPKK